MMEFLKTIKLDYPEWMSDADKQALGDQLNALFEHRQFASEAEMNQAIQEAVETHLGMDLQLALSPVQLLLEWLPLIISAVSLVVGLYWRYVLGQ